MDEQPTGTTQQVEVQTAVPQTLQPHRGVMILVLGILGIVCCFICGIVAWVMGNNDLRDMDAGIMDPSGRGLTQAGKICGIVSIVFCRLCSSPDFRKNCEDSTDSNRAHHSVGFIRITGCS